MEKEDVEKRDYVSWRRWSDGGDYADDTSTSTGNTYPLFTELAQLSHDNYGRLQWKEVARWVKYEEDVEECGIRWSKPFVPTIPLRSLHQLITLYKSETTLLMLDYPATKRVNSIWNRAVNEWMARNEIVEEDKEQILHILTCRKAHLFQEDTGLHLNGFEKGEKQKPETRRGSNGLFLPNGTGDRRNSFVAVPPGGGKPRFTSNANKSKNKSNTHFMKKITSGSESFVILVGEVNCLHKHIALFLRFSEGILLDNLTEVPLPTRFIFVLLGPRGGLVDYKEMGRGLATAMLDSTFREMAYTFKTNEELGIALENYSKETTLLPPPPEWDPAVRIEPQPMAECVKYPVPLLPQNASGDLQRSICNVHYTEILETISGKGLTFITDTSEAFAEMVSKIPMLVHYILTSGGHLKHFATKVARGISHCVQDLEEEGDAEELMEASGLKRTGRPFGCFINDIRRKLPWYWSDFRDALSLQCVATWLFLYFACLTPIITFGGLLGEATHSLMGTMETIVAASICGITFALFSGQPLLILGATGPMLVFEKILISICDDYPELELNYLELRLCIGLWIGIFLIVLVATEGSALIAYITKFTEENFATLISIIFMVEAVKNLIHIAKPEKSEGNKGNRNLTNLGDTSTMMPDLPQHENMTPTNVFLVSILLFLGTFVVSFLLKEFRSSPFFSTRFRYTVSDFAVILAIASMSGINAGIGLPVTKLTVPSEFEPTIPTRGWLVHPFKSNPIWTVFAASIPAALATILIFMDQQITAVIINRKSHKLKKGAGYHLDLFVLACLIVTNSFLGLPWLVAATVESVTNVGSLKLESEATAPGEKPQFLGVREQRVSNLFVYITVGLSVFLTPVLRHVPMPVLFGIFLYMGFSALRKQELFDRILLLFIPAKYQPDNIYIRQVPIRKIHLFTFIQITCLALLWIIKSISATAILFPLMLVVMMGVRKSLEFIFTQKELAALDDILPSRRISTQDKEDTLPIRPDQTHL